MADKKIQWHPGFAAAMDLELSANRKDLVSKTGGRHYGIHGEGEKAGRPLPIL